MSAADLAGGELHCLFSALPGEALAVCAQVCRSWRSVAESEALWQQQCLRLEPHPHLRRDDLLPAFGGSFRGYYAWRWPLLRRRTQRILVEMGGHDEEFMLQTHPAPALPSSSSGGRGDGGGSSKSGGGSSSGGQGQQQAQAMDIDGGSGGGGGGGGLQHVREAGAQNQAQAAAAATAAAGQHVCSISTSQLGVLQQATWSPAGALLAFTEIEQWAHGELACRVVVADGATGRRVCAVELGDPFPPFYFMWTACATRLMFLSNWEGDVVALRTLDIGPALLPAPPPGGGGSGGGAQPAAIKEVLLATARPLFLATSPTCTRLLWHGNCQDWGLCDAATSTAEDGADDDCFFRNALPCGSQAPQWLVDPAGTDWLVMPVMHTQPPADSEVGMLVLARLADISEAYEADGSRLSPSLLLNLSQQVAAFSSARDLFFAASADASMVAWCDRGELRICFRQTGAIHQIFPTMPLPAAGAGQQQRRQQQLAGGGGGGGGGGSAGQRPLLRGSVLAMQWSPDGRRLLLLARTGGHAPLVALSKRPQFRWVVYDAPGIPPPPTQPTQPAAAAAATEGAGAGWLGSLTHCCAFNPTLEFLDRYLPFWDQFSRSMRLWDPTSTAFCFTSRGRPTVPELSEDVHASVQPVPRPGLATSSGGGSSGASSSSGGGPPEPLAMLDAPPPLYLAPGNMASWSWQ